MCPVHNPEVLIDPLAFPDFPESAKQSTADRLLSQQYAGRLDLSSLIKFATKLKNGLLTFTYGKIGEKFLIGLANFPTNRADPLRERECNDAA
jgi:hypothetical protein